MRFLILSLGIALAVVVPSASAQETATALPDWAAPGPPPSYTSEAAVSTPPNPPSAPAQVPLDGGLGLLALAGGVYAARRLRARGAEGA